MAQSTTVLATGIRAFNALTTSGGSVEDVVISVANGDGSQLALEELDGTVGGDAVTFRAYALGSDGSSSQIAQFSVAAGSNFRVSFKGGAYSKADEFLNQKVSFQGAVNLGLVGSGGIRVTASSSSAVPIAVGATFDRRVDGPI